MLKVKYLPLILVLSLGTLQAKKDDAPAIDHLANATMMIFDGKFDKAEKELDAVDQTAPNFDAAKYHTMIGVLAVKKEAYQESIDAFTKAIEATKVKEYQAPPKAKPDREYLFSILSKKKEEKPKEKEPAFDPEKVRQEALDKLHIHLSKSYYKLKDYANTIQALDNAGELGRNRAGLFTLRADCYWKLKDHNGALEALSHGHELFPDDASLLKQKFYYLAELKLYQAAIDASKAYMDMGKASPKEYLALAQMLMSGEQLDLAIQTLEEAKLIFPNDAKLNVVLGHAYLKRDMVHVTAQLFERGSYYDHNYTKEAAEMYRRAKDLPHALYLNAQIVDKKEKLKQKVAILIEREEYEKVIGLEDGLKRYAMLSDDNLRYALGYAYYMVKDYDRAEEQFKKINDNDLFSKATVIRKNIEKCKKNSLECL
ncbi:MAG TPA: hypothetical protein ENK86_03870 [Campylobacterales bacterium]|nr:hypothetical protein [Campylobacterales bacterium]